MKLVVLKNIMLPGALPPLTLHIGRLKIARPEQLLTEVNDEILCICVYTEHSQSQTTVTNKTLLCHPQTGNVKRRRDAFASCTEK